MKERGKKFWQVNAFVIKTSSSVGRFSFKVDDCIKTCKNIVFSFNVEGKAAKNYVMGDICLFVNNRKENPIQYTLHSIPQDAQIRKIPRLELKTAIEGGSFIHGHYRDLGLASSYAYTLRIYLECITNG